LTFLPASTTLSLASDNLSLIPSLMSLPVSITVSLASDNFSLIPSLMSVNLSTTESFNDLKDSKIL